MHLLMQKSSPLSKQMESGELFCINKCIQFKQVIKTSINYFIMKRRQVILYPCLPEAFLSELCLPCPCLL